MPDHPFDYSVIIPCYNEEHLLGQTLVSLQLAQAAVAAQFHGEVIVVDNASTDATATVALAAGARVIPEPKRQIARARNAGATAARGHWLIFIDADTLISPELLRASLEALATGVICGGGARLGFIPDPQGEQGSRLVRLLGECLALGVYGAGCWGGAFTYCDSSAFTAVGGFDEKFFAAEDVQFAKSLRQWARSHGRRTKVMRHPVQTSLRKARSFGAGYVAKTMLNFLIRPSLLQRQEACGFWYAREGGEG